MRRVAPLVITAIAVVTVGLFAQTPPNFAGKWTLVGEGGGRGGLGQEATIKQDASSLTITRTTQMGEFTSTYKLDGTESKNTLNMGGNAVEQISTAKWDGAKLVVKTSMSFDGNPVQLSMTMALDPSGNMLIESTRPDFQGGGAPITTKATYKKN